MVIVRYYASARAAAGVAEEKRRAETLRDLLTDLGDARGPDLRKVLDAASFLVNGVAWRDREATFPAGATIDVLPPFAGG